MTDIFQPFTDRLSRDIRNELSSACAACLRQGEIGPAQRTAEPYLAAGLAECYIAYINDRLHRYRQAVAMAAGGSTDPIHQALILWNLGLFFEVHEILEEAWLRSEGREKLVLQALIRAAGYAIKSEHGYLEQAKSMAAKALPVLEANQDLLTPYCRLEPLLAALRDSTPLPLLVPAGYPAVSSSDC